MVGYVRACASAEHPLLVATDGLITYVNAFGKAFRSKHYTGRVGAPRLIAWPKVVIGQVLKRYQRRRVVDVERRLKQGSSSQLTSLLDRRQGGGGVLNTAYIERLNATFRARLAVLVRRSRGLARQHRRLHAGMYLVGTVYNFCTNHASLSSTTNACSSQRTPAMAAGLTSHRWSMAEVLEYHVSTSALAATEAAWAKIEGHAATHGSVGSMTTVKRTPTRFAEGVQITLETFEWKKSPAPRN